MLQKSSDNRLNMPEEYALLCNRSLYFNTYVVKNADFQPPKYINTKVLKFHHPQELIHIRYAKFKSPKINLETINQG